MSDSLKIYLAGRVAGLEDEGRGWREDVVKQLQAIAEWNGKKVEIFDPTKYFSYAEKRHRTVKQIKSYYMDRLSKCDIVLLNCNGTQYSIGTAQEIQFAVDHGIPIIGFGTSETYNWIVDVDCQVVFDSMPEATDYIRDFYL